jgi:hypothetical protein
MKRGSKKAMLQSKSENQTLKTEPKIMGKENALLESQEPVRLRLSSKKRIPLLVISDREYYPWQIPDYMRLHKQIARMVHSLGFEFSHGRIQMLHRELKSWRKCYVPLLFEPSDDPLILDAGAGEGETIMFYYLLGFRRFRCVELNKLFFKRLNSNVAKLGDADVHSFNRGFAAHDVYGVDFAKIDVEGGEAKLIEADNRKLPKEIVVETHSLAVQKLLPQSFNLEYLMELGTSSAHHCTRIWRWVNPNQ